MKRPDERDGRSDLMRTVRSGLATWAAREFAKGLEHAETHCFECGAEHPREATHCPRCQVDLLPF